MPMEADVPRPILKPINNEKIRFICFLHNELEMKKCTLYDMEASTDWIIWLQAKLTATLLVLLFYQLPAQH